MIYGFKKTAAAKADLEASQQSVAESLQGGVEAAVDQFKVVTSAAEEQAKAKRDQIIKLLGRELVDGFKPRMCIASKINPDYTVEYTPDPIRMTELSDEGLKCLNTLEIWFLSSMVITMIVSLIALVRAWNHRHDFKKVILSRYKWFGIDHGGKSTTRNAHIPTESPEFAEPCTCFDKLGQDLKSFLCKIGSECLSVTYPNL